MPAASQPGTSATTIRTRRMQGRPPPEKFDAIPSRQHPVKNDHIEGLGTEPEKSFLAISGNRRFIALPRQSFAEGLGRLDVIFNDEHFHCWTRVLRMSTFTATTASQPFLLQDERIRKRTGHGHSYPFVFVPLDTGLPGLYLFFVVWRNIV